MRYDGIAIFSDLDGTLLDDNRELSKENLEAISDFVSQGGHFGLATGRTEKTACYNFPELPLNVPSIFFNGALIFDIENQKTLYSSVIQGELEPILKDILRRFPTTCIEINTSGRAYVFNINDIIRLQLKREGLIGLEAPWENIPSDWLKVLFADKHQTLRKIKKELESLDNPDINIMFSEEELLDMMARGVSKGAALTYLKGLNRDKWRLVAAIGDNDNDLEMIKAADIGFAVENAAPGVKRAAEHEIAQNNVPCIPQVLRILDSYVS